MWEARYAPLSGVLFGVLLAAGFLIDPNTDFMPAEPEAVAYFHDAPLRIMVASYLGLLAAAALIWFSASLAASLRGIDDDDGRLSRLAFGGGVMAAVMLAVGEIAIITAAERVWVAESIDAAAATTLFDLSGIAFGNGAPIGFALLIGSAAVVAIRSRIPMRWPAWTSLVIAVALISPYGWAALAAVLIWTPVAGIVIFRAESPLSLVEVS